jgi:N6-L-threonylcarbamoyladenine synthase
MSFFKNVLAVETSCDDTSVAVVRHDGHVVFCASAGQDEQHRPFGGIVPEIAGRNHTENLLPLIRRALEESELTWEKIDGFAVTNRPGLVGSLLVGVVTVKSLALAQSKLFIGVNHLEGHILAPFLRDGDYAPPEGMDFPFVALAVSGGHSSLYKVKGLGSYEVVGRTVDDAAGEAFDKFATKAGLGWPGGAHVDRLAAKGDPHAFEFPRAMVGEDNFSFSGLKTAAQRLLSRLSPLEISKQIENLCASYQEAIVETLVTKLESAAVRLGVDRVVVTGGVSANSRLREAAAELARKHGWQLVIPPLRYCTDNAAMIGYAGVLRLNRGEHSDDTLGVSPEVTL